MKILIVSYYYPPTTAVASFRTHSWALKYSDMSHDVHVITRHWTGNESSWSDFSSENLEPLRIDKEGRVTVHRIPHKKSPKLNTLDGLPSLIRPFAFNMFLMNGHIQMAEDFFTSSKKYVAEFCKNEKPDVVLLSVPPFNLIKLVPIIKETLPQAKVVSDFRDTWDNHLLKQNYTPSVKRRVLNYFMERHLTKWSSQSDLVTSVSPAFTSFLKERFRSEKAATVYNGFLESAMKDTPSDGFNHFQVSVVGTVYMTEPLELFFEGLSHFLKRHPEDARASFVGAAATPNYAKYIDACMQSDNYEITNKLKHQEALRYVKGSHALGLITWRGFKGVPTTKLFEYLASERNILVCPDDEDIVSKIVKETETGAICNTPDEVSRQLEDWYKLWKEKGDLKVEGNKEKISFYSRENQAEILLSELLK